MKPLNRLQHSRFNLNVQKTWVIYPDESETCLFKDKHSCSGGGKKANQSYSGTRLLFIESAYETKQNTAQAKVLNKDVSPGYISVLKEINAQVTTIACPR